MRFSQCYWGKVLFFDTSVTALTGKISLWTGCKALEGCSKYSYYDFKWWAGLKSACSRSSFHLFASVNRTKSEFNVK